MTQFAAGDSASLNPVYSRLDYTTSDKQMLIHPCVLSEHCGTLYFVVIQSNPCKGCVGVCVFPGGRR